MFIYFIYNQSCIFFIHRKKKPNVIMALFLVSKSLPGFIIPITRTKKNSVKRMLMHFFLYNQFGEEKKTSLKMTFSSVVKHAFSWKFHNFIRKDSMVNFDL
uniref:Uncharacterized protein n=1 Tax=Cacopsylla melanoneura TaxID=428564 RepID=A0A8D8VCX9_9HEMI